MDHCISRSLFWKASASNMISGKKINEVWKKITKSLRKKMKVFGERMFCLPFDYIQLLQDKDDTEKVARGQEKTSYSFALWKAVVWSHGEIPLEKNQLNKIPLLIYFRNS